MEITPEVQAQLDQQKAQCPFCKIVTGEITSKKVFSDNLIMGILDINPWVKGHTLLLPKEHYPIMPFIPPETFSHLFGLIPEFSKAFKEAMICMGFDVFIANGGVAGQQAQHFMIHLLPRDKGDKIYNFWFNAPKEFEKEKSQKIYDVLANNIPLMMNNHFQKNNVSWHKNNGVIPKFLSPILKDQRIIYEDEKVIVISSKNMQSLGHLEIYSKQELSLIENLDFESSAHLFFVASFCATAVFEGLGAQGSNIIMKSGISDGNEDGLLCIHILPRFQDDGIDILPKPLSEKPNLDSIASKITDKTSILEYNLANANKEDKVEVIEPKKEILISDKKLTSKSTTAKKIITKQEFNSFEEEINNAIDKFVGN